jgi:uncharacterized protein (TIGR00661 family)
MRILFGIQLTGNGHINRSQRLISELRSRGHKVDVVVSGSGNSLDYTDYKFRFRGFSIYSNNKGGINWIKTIFSNNPFIVLFESIKLKSVDYDLVVSDFEPVSIWSSLIRGKKCISISNQNDILNWTFNPLIRLFIKTFTINSLRLSYSYSKSYDNSFLPIISEEVSNGVSYNSDFYLIYLPYIDLKEIYKELEKFGRGKWKVYHNDNFISDSKNIKICKIDKKSFTKDLLHCKGIVTASGFSTTSEALILGKKLWSIPLKGQFEQKFNSLRLEEFGIFTSDFNFKNIEYWIKCENNLIYKWKDPTNDIIKKIELYAEN